MKKGVDILAGLWYTISVKRKDTSQTGKDFKMEYLHEMLTAPDGTMIMIDVSNTWDAGWEGAYAVLDEETFRKAWESTCEDENTAYTAEDVEEWGEEWEAFDGWRVVSGHHRNPETAERNLRKYLHKIFGV